MSQRIMRFGIGVGFWALSHMLAFAELPEKCKSPESSFTTLGGNSKMHGDVWTDVVQADSGDFVAVSAKRSKVAWISSTGLVLKEIQLPDSNLRPTQLALQPNGRILITGIHTSPAGMGMLNYELQVLGFNANGDLDKTFGSQGIFRYPSITGYSNISVRCDGRIYLAFDHGYHVLRRLRYEFVVMKLTENGNLDPTFGSGGASAVRIGRIWNSPETVVIRDKGEILVGGQAHVDNIWEGSIFQLRLDGSLDPNFGQGSGAMRIRSFSGNNPTKSVALLSNGGFVTVGYDTETNWISIAKHLDGGLLDTGFGANGFAYIETPAIAGQSLIFSSNAVSEIQGSGFLVGGRMSNVQGTEFWYLVTRLKAFGEIDRSFGTFGFVSIPLPTATSGGELIGEASGAFVIVAGGRQPEAAVHRFDAFGKMQALEFVP